ncbi:glutathione S-transferase family protein [Tabrizicola sp.]|uniref:glutathione S-transferase family protein n=1 Tax=Tabrizicola sp. TaxID=2005166 RepID=UPI003F3E6EB8
MENPAPVTLTGYRHSVCTRIARMALIAKGAAFIEVEVNPFAPPLPDGYPHPFGRVLVLSHSAFTLYETSAITRYIDLAFPGPPLVPPGAKATARMAQVISIADAYAFRPLVLQVYAHRVFRPAEGLPPDEAQIKTGLAAAPTVLEALDAIANEGAVLNGTTLTLADCHLAPMIAAFDAAPESRAILGHYPALRNWWGWIQNAPSFAASGRSLPAPTNR